MNNTQQETANEEIKTEQDNEDILFTRGVLSYLNLAPKNIMLSCGPYRFVAVLQVANFQRIQFVTPDSGLLEEALEKYDNIVSIRFVFANKKEQPLNVPGVFDKMLPYPPNKKYKLAAVKLDAPLPERYEQIISSILEIERRARDRLEPRIRLASNDRDYFGLDTSQTLISIGGAAQRCYLRDLSASGANIIILDNHLPRMEDDVYLILHLNNQFYPVEMESHIMKADWYDESKQLIQIVLRFVPENVPVSYYTFLDKIVKFTENENQGRPLAI